MQIYLKESFRKAFTFIFTNFSKKHLYRRALDSSYKDNDVVCFLLLV